MNKAKIFVKLVIFSVIKNDLKIFLTNNNLPYQNIETDIQLEEIVKKLFEEKTNIKITDKYLEQLYTVSEKDNITIVYFILIPEVDIKDKNGNWKSSREIDKKNSDSSIIFYAIQRLQWKIEYTNVVYSLLPEEFTLSNLQEIYEAIFDKKLDKRNFRKKILSLNFLTQTEKKRIGKARPATIYKFKQKNPVMVNVFS